MQLDTEITEEAPRPQSLFIRDFSVLSVSASVPSVTILP